MAQGLPEFLVHRHDLEGKMGDLVGYILLVSKTSGRNETKGAPEQGSLKHRTQESYLDIVMPWMLNKDGVPVSHSAATGIMRTLPWRGEEPG